MRSWRVSVSRLALNGVEVEVSYADVFVVLREGDAAPGPNDWEATVRTADRQRLPPGTYDLEARITDGSVYEGHAVLRYSDGVQHLFRGDGHLAGFDPAA
jgi:hypothetical protein